MRSLDIREAEFQPVSMGFASFFCALSGYFLLLPLRDEAGVSLGTDKLPRLFVASLFLTFLATPLATAFLHRSESRERGLQLLLRALGLSILAFLLLYLAVGNPVPAAHLYGNTHPPPASVAALPTDDPQAAAEQQRQDRRELLAVLGAVQLTRPQAAVRVAFFLWVSLLNLVAVASLWARSADVFSPEAAGRLFGLLGAGATLGQLLGSLAAGALARAPQLGGGGGSPSLLPLLLSAAAFELGGQAAGRYRGVKGASSQQPEIEEGGGAEAEAMVRHASSSSLIAPLQGSSSSGKMVRATSRGVMAITIGREFPAGGGTDLPDGATNVRARAAGSKGSSGGRRRPSKDGSFLGQLLVRTMEGYRLIRASPYLMHVCAYLALNYITSSFFFFEKTIVVAGVQDAASRTAWFATINSTSAFFILGLQLLATGRVLRYLGLPVALSILPASAGLMMACIVCWPTPSTVAMAEVFRKIVAYSLARPARESLFTVVSREEKYKAKIFLDTVVQRIGDTLAAAAFQALQLPALGFGPSGMAVCCVPVCVAWALVAYRLGLRQEQLAVLAAKPLAV
ncbi:hypothetical protein D9Q98_001227 [Chlorella vulgaris]|uniref:ADP,ATP carrier protein n=1 Tax=Chlorella vulgaris TaxID=3077 RepID=A0A9D4U076_CHLVU|nr:hypothetical protein D9Q98_001227 [Chlorella vulgaris]